MRNTDKSLQKEPSEFGRRIAEARLRAGSTQVELAKRLGVTRHVFEQVSKLPRRQQEKVVEFVEAFVQHKAAAG